MLVEIEELVKKRSRRAAPMGAGVLVVSTSLLMILALFGLGFTAVQAVVIAVATLLAALAVSCTVTAPARATKIRTAVVIIVITVVLQLLAAGYPVVTSLAAVVVTAGVAGQVARHLAGKPLRLPRLTF